MRTQLEIKERIKLIQKYIDRQEQSIKDDFWHVRILGESAVREFIHHASQEICLLKWVLEPAYNEHNKMGIGK